MPKETKSLTVSAATHYRVSVLAAVEGVKLGEWVEKALIEAVNRAEKRRAHVRLP